MVLISLVLLPLILVEKLIKPIESSWSWWISAYLKGRKLCKKQKFDLIYSTGGAFSAHMAGAALKKYTGLPWVAEIHDPLVYPNKSVQTAQARMQKKVEQLIAKNANHAVWFTQKALESARSRNPELGGKGHALIPGVDNPFQLAMPMHRPTEKLILGHFGSLSETRTLGPLIEALEELFFEKNKAIDNIELHVYGGPLDPLSQSKLNESPVANLVRHFGRVEADPITGLSGREQIMLKMRAVDVLILTHGEDSICSEYIPSKMYEYFWTSRPVLAVVHDNPEMTDLLVQLNHRVVQSMPGNEKQVPSLLKQEIISLHEQWKYDQLPDVNTEGSPYSTEACVHNLLQICQFQN
jgi:hypothetical protein